jgi:hypothetical protein
VVGIRSLPTPHLVAEMGLTINALPHTFVLSDKLLAISVHLPSGDLVGLLGLVLAHQSRKLRQSQFCCQG